MSPEMLDKKTKSKVKHLIHELDRKLFLLEGEECSEERRMIIGTMTLSEKEDGDLDRLKKLLDIGE